MRVATAAGAALFVGLVVGGGGGYALGRHGGAMGALPGGPGAAAPPLEIASGSPFAALARAWFGQKDCAGRLALILSPDRNRKLLEKESQPGTSCSFNVTSVDDTNAQKELTDHGMASIQVGGTYADGTTWSGFLCVVKAPDALKVDWRCTTAYSPVSLKAMRVAPPSTPTPVRAIVELSDYYNYEFLRAKETHLALKLRDEQHETLNAYVPRASEPGKTLFELLKDGATKYLIVEIAPTPRRESGDIVLLTKLVQRGWRETPDGI